MTERERQREREREKERERTVHVFGGIRGEFVEMLPTLKRIGEQCAEGKIRFKVIHSYTLIKIIR